MEYKDIFESAVRVVEGKSRKSGFLDDIEFPWGRSDVFNKNHRYYPHKTFTAAVTGLNNRIGKANVPGQVDHPLGGGSTRLGDVSHILTKVWMDENKVAWARASILDTQKGRDTLKIIKSGVTIGASLRGYGEVDKDGKVKPGLEVKTVDLVVDPSFGADARVDQSSVIESYISEVEYQFSENDLQEITSAMDELNDETISLIQKKLSEEDNIEMSAEKVKALTLWIRMSKDNPNIAPFHEWFEEQRKLFAKDDPNLQEELNDGLRREANLREEKNIAGASYGTDRKRIEKRQQEIDEALSGKKMSEKTVSRLFAEALLAGYKGSRADWIREFGF
jgi:hypothetical protein